MDLQQLSLFIKSAFRKADHEGKNPYNQLFINDLDQLDDPKIKFISAFVHLMSAHKKCFPQADPDWAAVYQQLLPEKENLDS